MLIRLADLSDTSSITNIAQETWWKAYKNIISDEQIEFMLQTIYSVEAIKEQIDSGHLFILATEESKTIGFASYSIYQSYIKIHKLYVLTDFQRKGVGQNLITHISETAIQQGICTLELNVNRNNPALSFYQKLGFAIYKSEDIPYFNFVLNDFVMRKTIYSPTP